MKQSDACQLAMDLLDEHGLLDKGWRFRFNRRKRSCGLCRYAVMTVELSAYFVEMNDQRMVRETLLHEIAHALAGPGIGHGPQWRAIARRIGAKAERTATNVNMPAGAWQGRCHRCRAIVTTRHRRPKTGAVYRHRTCGGVVEFEWNRRMAGKARPR